MVMFARWFATPVILLIAASAALPAASATQPPASRTGIYAADASAVPPDAGFLSTIALQPGGRFEWRLTMRGLSLSAHGTWDRSGGMIHLNNPQQVGAPEIVVAGTARDPASALRVRLDPATARMASALELELEFRNNDIVRLPFEHGEVRIAAGEDRPVAVRLASTDFGIRTRPIAVTRRGDNVLILRLAPADLGQAFFGSQQTRFDARGMTLDWRGISLRYNRVTGRGAGG